MKKVIIILMTIILCFAFAVVVSAEETEQDKGQEIKTYIEEKIVPIVVGVITSIIALMGTLKGVLNALKGLKSAKDDFDATSENIKSSKEKDSNALKEHCKTIEDAVKNVPELLSKIEAQQKTIKRLEEIVFISTEILSLAYSANSELVRTGKAKEMHRLIEKVKETTGIKVGETANEA